MSGTTNETASGHRPLVRLTEREALRFQYSYSLGSGCWNWKRQTKGCPRVRIGGVVFKASRVSYYIATGKDPGALLVCHHCDNPRCMRPSHFFLGTTQDNTADRTKKGRTKAPRIFGSANYRARLNEKAVREIRSSTLGYRRLAKRFGVTRNAIRAARIGRTWGHIQ